MCFCLCALSVVYCWLWQDSCGLLPLQGVDGPPHGVNDPPQGVDDPPPLHSMSFGESFGPSSRCFRASLSQVRLLIDSQIHLKLYNSVDDICWLLIWTNNIAILMRKDFFSGQKLFWCKCICCFFLGSQRKWFDATIWRSLSATLVQCYETFVCRSKRQLDILPSWNSASGSI